MSFEQMVEKVIYQFGVKDRQQAEAIVKFVSDATFDELQSKA